VVGARPVARLAGYAEFGHLRFGGARGEIHLGLDTCCVATAANDVAAARRPG
jgi:hypothetical protein